MEEIFIGMFDEVFKDYLDDEDLLDAKFLALAEAWADKGYNLASGRGGKVNELWAIPR